MLPRRSWPGTRRAALAAVARVAVLLCVALATPRVSIAQWATLNLPLPTMGGKQFWADELFFHQWRIQRNVLDGHCRLLDEREVRRAWGSFDQCRAALSRIQREQNLPPMRGKAVIVLHGLFRSRSAMEPLARYLREQGGYEVFGVGYPSTQRDVAAHAHTLARIVENLTGMEEINFVGHSMGNIVIRHYLADQGGGRSTTARTGTTALRRADRRLHRFVMLAPPNHGSLAALVLAENGLFKLLTGEAGQQLGAEWASLESHLATPPIEFGIIAGGKGNADGYNPLLPGDDDATISVSTTRLAGARDFLVVPALHSFIMNDRKVHECTLRFLQKGCFVSDEARQPIENE